ncbi:hypothetical protein KSP39_PZI015062 [Platanthera zijinensis]|uniref:TFIIS N-terminal domain-containing protein n=1 Tax=Platanthera zijinensis TaxID=2320716 RepID=A0AAP0BA85_9ASPA
MTLEDFFTLTEMKYGLTTCARVEELIYVMQKQSCITNNVGDATRQWSTAASTLASTQNTECLDLFVHLNGLDCLNFWLQEADKYSRDVSDGEELINKLLTSLDKLPMNFEKIISSGIFATVEKLVCHINVHVMERAKILFKKWKDNDNSFHEMDKDSSYPVDHLKPSGDAASIAEEVGSEGRCKIESGRTPNPQITSDYALQLGDADEVKGSTHYQTSPARCSNKIENHMLLTSSVSDGCGESISVHEASCLPSTGIPFSTAPASPEIQVADDEQCDISVRNDIKSDLTKGKCDSWEFRETSGVASSYAKNPTVVRSASCNLALKEGESNVSEDKKTLHRCASVDCVWLEYSKTVKELKLGENGSLDLLDLPSQGSLWREEAAENTSDVERCDDLTLQTLKGVDRSIYGTSSVQANHEIPSSSDSDTESGEIDALEIARQVAIQVEREVVDYREELCSSSPEVSSNETMNADSPSIEPTKVCHPIPGEANGYVSVPIKDDCECTSSPKDNNHMVTEVSIDPSKDNQNMETPNGAAVIHEFIARANFGNFDFDLNEEASIEDIDCAVSPLYSSRIVNLSTPVAVFASKGPPGFHTTPLCFEGGLGWRGSAATSAFRPASPRKITNGEKSDSGSIFKGSLLGLDLNVRDCENFSLTDMKEVPVSSSIPSWNSTSDFSSPRTERFKLDLNSNGEEEATPSQSSFIKHHFLNRDQSSSPPSSSPPPRRSSHKNFDLNDNLFFSDAAVSKNLLGVKIDDSVITNMGSTRSFESRVHTSQAHQPYMGSELSFDATLPTMPFLPYSHQISHPGFGYIGSATGVALPFQPAVYGFGNIQHIVDSRGATAFPQLLSSAGTNGGPSATPPFLMSITSVPSSSNVGGPSQMGLDLNFGMIPKMESGTGEEQFKTASQHGTSGNSLKRKEPDSGWEPYSFGYKHVASWH